MAQQTFTCPILLDTYWQEDWADTRGTQINSPILGLGACTSPYVEYNDSFLRFDMSAIMGYAPSQVVSATIFIAVSSFGTGTYSADIAVQHMTKMLDSSLLSNWGNYIQRSVEDSNSLSYANAQASQWQQFVATNSVKNILTSGVNNGIGLQTYGYENNGCYVTFCSKENTMGSSFNPYLQVTININQSGSITLPLLSAKAQELLPSLAGTKSGTLLLPLLKAQGAIYLPSFSSTRSGNIDIPLLKTNFQWRELSLGSAINGELLIPLLGMNSEVKILSFTGIRNAVMALPQLQAAVNMQLPIFVGIREGDGLFEMPLLRASMKELAVQLDAYGIDDLEQIQIDIYFPHDFDLSLTF